MPFSGLEIYKLLPQTNCKECGYPTCLAFAMKLAAKQAELKGCPYVSEESKAKLEAAWGPPIRLIQVVGDEQKLEVGNETVLFRHEKTFYHRPGIFLHLRDTEAVEALRGKVAEAEAFQVDYVGIRLGLDGVLIEAPSGPGAASPAAIASVRPASKKPLILMAATPALARAGLQACTGTRPLLHAATAENAAAMAAVATEAKDPLGARAETPDALAELTAVLTAAGVEDIVLDPGIRGYRQSLHTLTHPRRLARRTDFRPLGFPVITFPGLGEHVDEPILAAEHIAKHAGFILLAPFAAPPARPP